MLLEAILGIIAISVGFCCCTLCCYVVFHHIFTEEKGEAEPDNFVWEAQHYYDPLPMATPSPPDAIFKPTPYTFKLQNGNGVYSSDLPHAVINPAVLQYPPGHVYDQQRISQPKPAKPVQENSRKESIARIKRESSFHRRRSKSRSHSPSPSPHRSPRGPGGNVWSTNTDFQQPHGYYSNHHQHSRNHNNHQHHHSHSSPHRQDPSPKQYVQLTQEHYPLQEYRQHPENHRPRHENGYHKAKDSHSRHHDNHDHKHSHRHHSERENSQHFQAFMATTHATNVYTPSTQRKLYRSVSQYHDDIT